MDYWKSVDNVEKFQHSSALPNIKYDCVVLFLVNYIRYLFMLPKKFSYRQPLYDLFARAELRALHPSCSRQFNTELYSILYTFSDQASWVNSCGLQRHSISADENNSVMLLKDLNKSKLN